MSMVLVRVRAPSMSSYRLRMSRDVARKPSAFRPLRGFHVNVKGLAESPKSRLQSSVRRFDSGPGLQPQNGALISRDFLPLFVPPDTTALSGGVNRPAGCPRVTGRRLPDPSSAAAALPLRRVDVPQRAVARRGLRHGTVEASLHTWVRRPTGSRHGPVVTGKCTIFTANPYPFASPAPDLQGPDTPDTRGNAASCALCVGMVESVKLIVY